MRGTAPADQGRTRTAIRPVRPRPVTFVISSPLHIEAEGSVDPRRVECGESFGRALAGDWQGRGFSLAVWPSRHPDQPCFLELHETTESLSVAAADDALQPSTLVYDQYVSDMVSGMRLSREAGMWFAHPASLDERQAVQTLTLISTDANGAVTVASGGISRGGLSDWTIAPIDTAPFASGERSPKARGRLAPYDLGDVSAATLRCRTPLGSDRRSALEGLAPQAVLDDPTCLLRAVVERQVVESVMTASLADATGDGDPTFRTTLWVERIRDGAVGFDQLQYVQATKVHFAPVADGPIFVWPQVRVATLRRVSRQRRSDFH